MSVYIIDPVADPRWSEFVDRHSDASVFHSAGWLEALRRTYGYHLLALTTSKPGDELTNGLPLCHVKNWSGSRLVSLPFSDHCEPLVERADDRDEMLRFLEQGIEFRTWKSVELRPRSGGVAERGGFSPGRKFVFHRCDLTPALDRIHARFHRSCIQRSIQRAERNQLEYQSGSSPSLVETFFRLLRVTRRRHGMPPQPMVWFQNLAATLGDRMTIRLASKAGLPIAGILTIAFKRSLVYKYGGSEASHHKLGGMPFLFWRAIQDAKKNGLEELDLGRSDLGHDGLTTFKERLGAERSTLTYYRHPAAASASGADWKQRSAKWLFERLPDPALTLAGRVLYKHLA